VILEPIHCRPAAHALLRAQMSQIDSIDGLVRGAVAIAMHELTDIESPAGVERALEAMRDRIRLRAASGRPAAVLAHAHAVMFDDAGFRGDEQDYYLPKNSYLPDVLQRRRGLPISLCLVYKAVLAPLGVAVDGIAAPGHFMMRVALPNEKPMLVDAFSGGRVLDRKEALTRVAQMTRQPFRDDDELLPVASHRLWLTRMLNNLQSVFSSAGRERDLAAMQELRAVLVS
jgi:regulator of sirC expression with transglutaminase-like and TPR domain